jgi:hypothetical protein
MWMFKLAGILLGILFPIVTAAETVTITSPSPTAGQVFANGCIQVFAVAQSSVGAKITAWQIYIDNVATPFSAPNTDRINTRICVPSVSIGSHSVMVQAWSANHVSGDSPVVNVTISSEYEIVAPAAEPLSPATGQSFNNGLIRIAASVYSPYPLTNWIVYIDGQIAFTSYAGAIQVETDLAVPVGTHDVTVKVWDVNKRIARYSASNVVVTEDVMTVPPFVVPPANALTVQNLDDKGAVKWDGPFTGAAASCRAANLTCAAMAPIAVAKPVQFVPAPAPLPVPSNGKAALFQTLPGTEWFGNAGYGTAIFEDHPTKVNYVSDMWVMLTSTNIQTLELDLAASLDGTEFMFGTQCDFASGYWDFWNDTPAVAPAHPHWQGVVPAAQNNDLVCNIQPNEWVHLRFNMFHDATSYQFVSLEINGVNHSLTELAPSLTSRKRTENGTSVQVQLDANNSATPFEVYISNFNVTTW